MSSVGKRVKLVQIIADSDLSGGPRHVLGILKNIDQDLFEPYLICPPGILPNEAKRIKGVKVRTEYMNSKYDFLAVQRIKHDLQIIMAEGDPFGPMIVHCHGPRAGFLGRSALPGGVFSVYTEHRWDWDFHLENKINEYFQLKFLKKYNYKTNLIIAVSNSVKDFLVKRKLAPASRVFVIPNGIDLEEAKSRVEGGKKYHQITIGSVGNLNKQKGYEFLIEAMAELVKKYPHIKLDIAGEGEERKDLGLRIKDLGLRKHITLLGRRDDVEKRMRHWDIFVLPSIAETFGIVLLEAMKNGLPIVATRVGGVPDIIVDGKNGLLVSKENPEALTKAIIELIEHPARGAELVRNGLAVVKNYDWKKVIKTLEEEYLKLTSNIQ